MYFISRMGAVISWGLETQMFLSLEYIRICFLKSISVNVGGGGAFIQFKV